MKSESKLEQELFSTMAGGLQLGLQNVRQVLLESFYDWLGTKSIGPDVLIFASPPDLDRLNKILVEYGRHLF